MVDAERLLAVLARITARLHILERYRGQDRAGLLDDEVRLGHLKYTFQTAIEACLDAAHHVVADGGLGVPASNAEVFRMLARAGLLGDELAAVMAGAAGFRNVLVHDYAEVDDARVVDNLAYLEHLRGFVAAMTVLLDRPPS
jgi:uncharacterized protein YutE (UPF0331/DUF86 family)